MNWNEVASRLAALADAGMAGQIPGWQLNAGQGASLHAIGERLPRNGVIIADEVGMGKTRIAVGVARSVIDCGGRVAILVPPGLGYQWRDELHGAGIALPPIVRSLWQFLAAWESECPERQIPWLNQSAVLLSHAFTNWRLGQSSAAWRWALLPAVYARWRKVSHGRYPRDYHGNERLDDLWVQRAAESIVTAAQAETSPASRMRELLDRLSTETPWPGALDAGAYAANETLRPWLEQAVGLGLGIFDLVIIDEAHKSRDHESALTRLLERVVQKSDDTRRIAMTATPVELNAGQWKSTLRRIAVDGDDIGPVVQTFAENVRRVRQAPSDDAARQAYRESASTFEAALRPYLLRRDKRQDAGVIAFAGYSRLPKHAYRREREIAVEPTAIPEAWRHVVCAAEALSIVTRGTDNGTAKRLRLTLGNGHGIAALIDQLTLLSDIDPDPDPDPECDCEIDPETGRADKSGTNDPEDKRAARARWWTDVIARTVSNNDQSLFDHPAIRSAVDAIEDAIRLEEKVLVFGRFIRPLQAMVRLLNARAMLKSMEEGRPWPQSKIPNDEWPAIEAVHVQLKRPGRLDREALNTQLAEQYRALEGRREILRVKLIEDLEHALRDHPEDTRIVRLFRAFRASVEAARPIPGGEPGVLALLARALLELLPDADTLHPPERLAEAFARLIDALSERDEGDADGNGVLDAQEASALWAVLEQRLYDEYNSPQSRFARLMYGGTKPETRRMLQLAFNRQDSWPKVLVSQSQVGREGLNLHTACRIVVLLHPEWNPGVVEQQIGRIDRVGSHWEDLCRKAIGQGCNIDELPRIEVRPVIFRGTYDEWNWQVLRQRWGDLRAQLHGVIIPPHEAEAYHGMEKIVLEINEAAPKFYPKDPRQTDS